MKMTGFCWTLVLLVFLLSAQHSFSAVDQNWLTNIIEALKNEYAIGDAFTLAVSIPQNQDPADLKQVLQSDPVDKVKEAVSQGQVYQGTSVIAATQSDGLSRVLENIPSLQTNNRENVLVIYSEVAPNSNDNSMADKINYVIQNWNAYAFVFSTVADVPTADASQLAGSFKLLEISKLGLDNIFRCYKPDDSFQCTSCSSGGDVTPSCVANVVPTNQEQGTVADAGAAADTGAGADTGAVAGTDTGADADTGASADMGAGADAGAVADADAGADAGADADAGAGADTGAGSGENVVVGAGTGAGVDAGTGAGTYTRNDITSGAETGLKRQGKAGKMSKRKRGSRKRKADKVRRPRKRGPRRNGRKRNKSQGGRGARRRGGRRGGKSSRNGGGRRGGRRGGKSSRRGGGRRGRKSAKRRGRGKRGKRGMLQDILWEW